MLCKYGRDVWQSELWAPLYPQQSLRESGYAVPPSGVYCADFCMDTFAPPLFYEFATESCQLMTINECLRGTSSCHADAFCIEPPNGVGFECRCDDNFFVTASAGTGCIQSGIQFVFHVVGTVLGGAGALDYEQNFANILRARLELMRFFIDNSYVESPDTRARPGRALLQENAQERLLQLLVEGVARHNIEMLLAGITDANSLFQGRSLWRVTLRFPSDHVDISTFVSTTIFNEAGVWNSVFNSSSQYQIHTVSRCANDWDRECVGNQDCLEGASCLTARPNIDMQILSAGGVSAPISVWTRGQVCGIRRCAGLIQDAHSLQRPHCQRNECSLRFARQQPTQCRKHCHVEP